MRNKALGVTIVLLSVLCLPACVLRVAGPCLGYGCPVMSGGTANANNATSAPPDANAAAQNTQATDSNAPSETKKKHHRFLVF
jgi:hypothetical protein